MGVPGNIRIFYSDHYPLSGATRSEAPRTAHRGLFFCFLTLPILVWRLREEERFLHKHLPGYTEYTQQVRYRLIPFVW
jgi:hypothetical protein